MVFWTRILVFAALETRSEIMSEDYEFSDDTAMMRMEEDGEANSDDPMSAAGDCGPMGCEAEGSRIDASKNEEDEG